MQEQINKSMDEFENRPIYPILTKEILVSLPDAALEQAIIDNIFCKLEAEPDYDKQYEIITGLSVGRQAIFATWVLEAEVINGGFNQFFYNVGSAGQYAEEARDGFVLIGAPKHAALTQKAMDLYMTIADSLSQFMDGTLESFSKSYNDNPLNALDDEFYDLESSENLSMLRTGFIRNNMGDFVDG